MNSKFVGNIGEAKVIAKFVEYGIPVYLPFGDNERADLIAEFNGKLNKIQVKTSLKAKNGVMVFNCCSSTAHRKNGKKYSYDKTQIDYFAFYNIQRDKILLLPVENCPITSVAIRYEEPHNGQIVGVRMEADYLLEKVLCKIK